MPHVQRSATVFLVVTVLAIGLLIAVLILLMTRPAWSAESIIPCWKAQALLAYAGNATEAEKIAQRHGYSKSQIAEVRKRCGL